MKVKPFWVLILLLAVVKFTLPFFLQSNVYELQRDEFLYYHQGQHLALGYMENPPLLSYLGAISSLLGGSVFWIKFWPAFFGAATLVVTCLLAAELGGKKFAQFLAGLAICTGAYLRVYALFQPNILDVFFWTLSFYFFVRYINDKQTKILFCFFISLALGFWGKYSVVFVAAGIFAGLLLTHHRKIFAEKKLYIAALAGLLFILPNVWWQYGHNWPLLHHMKELQETQLKFGSPVDFLKEQLMMLIATALIWLAGLGWALKNKQWRFLAYSYFVIILLLILGRGKSYYALGIYPMLLAAGAVAWERMTQKSVWVRYIFCMLIIGFTSLILPMLLPIWEPGKLASFYKKAGVEHKWEDQKNHDLPQDFADMLGWKELTTKTEKYFQSLPGSVKANTVIYCMHYGQAGSLRFYSNNKEFINRVITDNGSFLLWIPDTLSFKHMIFVGGKMPGKDDEVFQHFEKVTIADSVTNIYSRQLGDKIIFFENADDKALQIAKEGLSKMKKQFSR